VSGKSPRVGERRALPGERSRAVAAREQSHLAPGIQRIATLAGLAFEKGEKARLWDADGNEYIDFFAGVGVASLGHGHKGFARALSEQASNVVVGSFASKARADYMALLGDVLPKGLSRIQLYSGGAEAIEAAVRLAKSKTKGFELLSFWGGYHGKTLGAMSLTTGDPRRGFGALPAGSHTAPYPDPYRPPFEVAAGQDLGAACARFARAQLKQASAGALTAVFLEPIQGTAGNILPPPGFFAAVRDLARDLGALFVADEMITGFGRTGTFFAVEHEGVTPDIMTVGKGMGNGFPISAVITSEEISRAEPWAKPSSSSSSFGGFPLACAAGLATLRAIREENLVENSRRMGEVLGAELRALEGRFPCVGHVRGRGLLWGVELVADRTTKEELPREVCDAIFTEALARGLLVMATGPHVRINPPLVIDEASVREGVAAFAAAIEAVYDRGLLGGRTRPARS
jgi:4-aminobutyrate aminotransferase/(S)-3-amino-2-methylpropionate transaminase